MRSFHSGFIYSVVWSPFTAADIRRLEQVQNCFMRSAGFCLNIPHPEHDYRPISQDLKCIPHSTRKHNSGVNFIWGVVDYRVDAPRIIKLIQSRIPINTRFQGSFYSPNNKSNFSQNAPLSRTMRNENIFQYF